MRFELSDQLYDHARRRLSDRSRTHVFVDKLQRIEGWQDAVNAMRVDFDRDIYQVFLQSSYLYCAGCLRWVKAIPQDLLRAKGVSRANITFFDAMIEPSTVICRNVRPAAGIQNHDFASTTQITRPSFQGFGMDAYQRHGIG